MTTKRLILAFDIGTTYSGASYGVVEGSDKKDCAVFGVNRFTAKSSVNQDSKIPSHLLYYDDNATSDGKPVCVGAEVDELEQNPSDEAVERREKCVKVEWFKLLLRPNSMPLPAGISAQLPADKTPVDVFADYLEYLALQTIQYIEQADPVLATLLSATGLAQTTQFVITHPNGWEGPQQKRLRQAAKRAGLVAQEDDKRLILVSEGEASLHYCLHHNLLDDTLDKGHGVAVIDAGGGTVDISSYCKSGQSAQLRLEEIAPSQCLMNGSLFVTKQAEAYIKERLMGSRFEDMIPEIVKIFDEKTKHAFRGPIEGIDSHFVNFSRKPSDTDLSLGVKRGQFAIPSDKMVEFFQPSINAIIQSIIELKKWSSPPIKRALLVGGFAASDWLFKRLKDDLGGLGIELYRPDRNTGKAVADGAVVFCNNRSVTKRVSRFTYGVRTHTLFDDHNVDHLRRFGKSYVSSADGMRYLGQRFTPILTKGTQVEETKEFLQSFYRNIPNGILTENPLRDDILVYRGDRPINASVFMDTEPEQFELVFTYHSDLPKSIIQDISKFPIRRGMNNACYTEFNYDISINFGTTEMSAQASVKYQKPSAPAGVMVERKFTPRTIYFDRDSESEA